MATISQLDQDEGKKDTYSIDSWWRRQVGFSSIILLFGRFGGFLGCEDLGSESFFDLLQLRYQLCRCRTEKKGSLLLWSLNLPISEYSCVLQASDLPFSPRLRVWIAVNISLSPSVVTSRTTKQTYHLAALTLLLPLLYVSARNKSTLGKATIFFSSLWD